MLPKIAIIGRPNVGKSALFNAIIQKRIAIVDEHEGVTRDRLYATGELFGKPFQIIDTGGMLSCDLFAQQITEQAHIAIQEADGIIVVVDGKTGPQVLDEEVAKIIRKTKKHVVLAINKIDSPYQTTQLYEFACLGIRPMVPISALHKYQIAELLEALPLSDINSYTPCPTHTKIAIIGRPNVGKSLLTNTIVNDSRCIVSPIAGTTRDTIDSQVIINNTTYTILDTAGLRRTHKQKHVIEKFAHIRTEQAIERSDICILLADCQYGITTEEKKIATHIEKSGKGCVVGMNKWDLMKNVRMEHAMQGLEQDIPFLAHCPKLCISAKTGRNIDRLFSLCETVRTCLNARISTNKLNKALLAWMQRYHPPMIHGKRLRIYYMAQVDTCPPHFVLFVNSPTLMDSGYKRYLINNLRQEFGFQGVPFICTLRGKQHTKSKSCTAKNIDYILAQN